MLDEKEPLPVRLSQDEFYGSLEKIKKLSPSRIYSAHGKDIADIEQIIEGYKKAFAERQEKVLSIILDRGKKCVPHRKTAFPEIGGWRLPLEIFLSISEA